MTDCIVEKQTGLCPYCAHIKRYYKKNIDLRTGEPVQEIEIKKPQKKRARSDVASPSAPSSLICKVFPFNSLIGHDDPEGNKARRYLVRWQQMGDESNIETLEPIVFFSCVSHYWLLDYESRLNKNDSDPNKRPRYAFPAGFTRPSVDQEPDRLCRTVCERLVLGRSSNSLSKRDTALDALMPLVAKVLRGNKKPKQTNDSSPGLLQAITKARWNSPSLESKTEFQKYASMPVPEEVTKVVSQGIEVVGNDVIVHVKCQLRPEASALHLKYMFSSLLASSVEYLVKVAQQSAATAPRLFLKDGTAMTNADDIRAHLLTRLTNFKVSPAGEVRTDVDSARFIFDFIAADTRNDIERMSSMILALESVSQMTGFMVNTVFIRSCYNDFIRIQSIHCRSQNQSKPVSA